MAYAKDKNQGKTVIWHSFGSPMDTMSCVNTQLIEKGSFGNVFRAQLNGKIYALKQIPLENENIFKRECRMAFLTKDNQFTARVYKSYVLNNNGYLLMELCKRDMYEVLQQVELEERQVAILFRQLCRAVQELHQMGIAHLDLKLENVLMTDDNSVKLCDFGSATRFIAGKSKIVKRKLGTPKYTAPELIQGNSFLPVKADIWSLGTILYLLLTRTFPTHDLEDPSPIIGEKNFTLHHLDTLPLTKSCKNLVVKILQRDPSNRCSLKEILAHPWLSPSRKDRVFSL